MYVNGISPATAEGQMGVTVLMGITHQRPNLSISHISIEQYLKKLVFIIVEVRLVH